MPTSRPSSPGTGALPPPGLDEAARLSDALKIRRGRKAFSKKTQGQQLNPIATFRLRRIPASYLAAPARVHLPKSSIVPKIVQPSAQARLAQNRWIFAQAS